MGILLIVWTQDILAEMLKTEERVQKSFAKLQSACAAGHS